MSVSEIHDYPLRPEGFEEPLFPTTVSRRTVAEHLLRTSWLSRASELEGRSGQVVHVRREPVGIKSSCGRVEVVWSRVVRRSASKRQIVEVLDRWREVARWWDESQATNRIVVRVLLSGGAVVDLAREGAGWFLVGVVD